MYFIARRSFRSRASKLLLQRFCIGRRIYAGRSLGSDEHMNLYTIFQCAQLLQRLCALQRTRFPLHKLQERVAPKTVDALMAKITNTGRVGGVRDHASREVESAIIPIQDNFDLVGRFCFGWIGERMRSSDDVDVAIRAEFFDKLIDQARIDQWFIALNVNDECEVFRVACNFGHPIGPAAMAWRSQRDLGPPIKRGLGDPHIVGRDDDRVQIFGSP